MESVKIAIFLVGKIIKIEIESFKKKFNKSLSFCLWTNIKQVTTFKIEDVDKRIKFKIIIAQNRK